MQVTKGLQNFYITLAKESPPRPYEESDASTYDIDFHCMETDICRDSSDTDTNSSFTFDGIATMEVLEYEVRSSSSSQDLYSNNSSSGSDEDFLLAAVAAGAMIDTSTSYSSAFADTEDSDSENTYDSELSAADYWVCVKCKNKQNNPMFRYCEKCYQIRKNHFPPRPKQWKSRSKRKRGTENWCLGKVSKNPVSSKFYNCSPKVIKNKITSPLNSAAETSSEEEFRDRYIKKLNTSKRKQRSSSVMKGEKLSTNATSSKNVKLNANLSDSLECSINRKRKLILEKTEVQPSKKINTSENHTEFADIIDSDSETDTANNHTQLQKDSGISSAPPSSQEVPSSSLSDDHQNSEKVKNGHESSDDTVCEDLDAKDIAELEKLNTYHNVSNVNTLGRHITDISSLQTSCSIESQKSPLMKSISACTEQVELFSGNRNNSQSFADNFEFSAYGSCTTCLSAPKNGVFVHSKFVHLYCCYKCAVKIWNKSKRCPVCNCAVKNVMKLFVH